MRKILVTGAAGAIGRTLRDGLAGEYKLRLTDIKGLGEARDGEEVEVADLSDMDSVLRLCNGVDAVVHLAASLGAMRKDGVVIGETPWESILNNNIVATFNIFEASRQKNVPRVVYASSIHAHGFYRRTTKVGDHLPPRPDSRYGLSKVFGEGTGRLYADKYGLEVVSLRIATFKQEPTSIRDLGTWLSPGDAVRMTRSSLETLDVHFDVLYGVSNNRRGLYDNPNAKRFGYFPEDDSEAFYEKLLAEKTEDEPSLDRLFHAAHLAATEFDGDISKIT